MYKQHIALSMTVDMRVHKVHKRTVLNQWVEPLRSNTHAKTMMST